MKLRLLRILIALDICLFALLTLGGSKRNETISAAAWSLESDGKWQGRMFRPLIDWLFTCLERDHCYQSWMAGLSTLGLDIPSGPGFHNKT